MFRRRWKSNVSRPGSARRRGRYFTGSNAPDAVADMLLEAIEELRAGEIEKFIIRQPPMGEKDDYDSENSWISDGLPSSSRRRRKGGGRWEVGEWREK